MSIWLNTRQVIAILDSFAGNRVTLHYTNPVRPLIFQPETGPYYALAMPMAPP